VRTICLFAHPWQTWLIFSVIKSSSQVSTKNYPARNLPYVIHRKTWVFRTINIITIVISLYHYPRAIIIINPAYWYCAIASGNRPFQDRYALWVYFCDNSWTSRHYMTWNIFSSFHYRLICQYSSSTYVLASLI